MQKNNKPAIKISPTYIPAIHKFYNLNIFLSSYMIRLQNTVRIQGGNTKKELEVAGN